MFAHFWRSAVTVCLCGFLPRPRTENRTLLPQRDMQTIRRACRTPCRSHFSSACAPFVSVTRKLPVTLIVFCPQSHVAAGSGEPGGDEYHSLVLYHNNSPRWAEQIKLPIPVDMFRGSHVRFEFRHCSSK